MEEILASIRRIISDEDAAAPKPSPAGPKLSVVEPAPSAAVPPEPAEGEAEGERPIDQALVDDILELSNPVAAPGPAPAFPDPGDLPVDIGFAEPQRRDAAAARQEPEPPPPARAEPAKARALVSERTDEAVHAAFNHLAGTILSQNARTLEDLVKEMMRPMLKGWLDDNLPQLVERLVRDEIERVSRGRR